MGVCRDVGISGLAAAAGYAAIRACLTECWLCCATVSVVLYRWGCLSLHSRRLLMVDLAPLAPLRCGAFSAPRAVQPTVVWCLWVCRCRKRQAPSMETLAPLRRGFFMRVLPRAVQPAVV
jgi:hypothetical protein